MPTIMIDAIAKRTVTTLNAFPTKTGISTTMSARNIIEGKPNLDYNTLKLKLGAYVQLYEGTTNAQASRSVGANSTEPFKRNQRISLYVTQDRNEATRSHLDRITHL